MRQGLLSSSCWRCSALQVAMVPSPTKCAMCIKQNGITSEINCWYTSGLGILMGSWDHGTICPGRGGSDLVARHGMFNP